MTPVLYVQIGTQPKQPVVSFAAATSIWTHYRTEHNLGARESPKVRLFRGSKHIGHISYNGRCWGLYNEELADPVTPTHELAELDIQLSAALHEFDEGSTKEGIELVHEAMQTLTAYRQRIGYTDNTLPPPPNVP